MSARLHATWELLGRYGAALGHAWARRKELDPPQRLAHETQFLPAALALQETPAHPAPRVAMWLILAFAAIALDWVIFGKVDIVATAQGKVIPDDRTKLIQPLEAAVVKAIHVRDGQAVKAGDLLVELDATMAQADTDRLREEVLTAHLDAARATGMLGAITQDGRDSAITQRVASVDAARLAAEQRLLDGQSQEYRAKLDQLAAEIARREAELAANSEVVRKLEQTAPIARQRAQDLKDLAGKRFISRHTYLEQEQAAIEQEQDLAAQRAKMKEIHAALREAKQQRAALTAETRRQTLDSLHEAEQKSAALSQELVKAEQRGRLMRLTAPVDGTVQQLAVHTVGGVVTAAQPLMIIVPRDNALEVEALVANKDIGFVYPGQNAQIKVETFPYTKYGTLAGTVQNVSNDAIQDEKQGLVYSARVRLARATMQIENKTVNLTPGMAVTVEIKTGKRRLIEYFLSPLMQYRDESLRER